MSELSSEASAGPGGKSFWRLLPLSSSGVVARVLAASLEERAGTARKGHHDIRERQGHAVDENLVSIASAGIGEMMGGSNGALVLRRSGASGSTSAPRRNRSSTKAGNCQTSNSCSENPATLSTAASNNSLQIGRACKVNTLRPACGHSAMRYVVEWPKA